MMSLPNCRLLRWPLGFALMSLVVLFCGCRSVRPPEPFGACPSPAQLQWQRMEMNMFCHFGPNTFTGREWGDGREPDSLFQPLALDCRQWAAVAKAAGMRGIILTAKHHDGYCLWPTRTSVHSVSASSWRNGTGDVLSELRRACDAYGLSMGVYISPWDRNHPAYGTSGYNDVFAATLSEVHQAYGPLFEQWLDGANGEGPDGKRQRYDWPLFHRSVYAFSSQAVIFSDVGPGCRWVGNEEGRAGETCWSTLNTEGFAPGAEAPPTDTLGHGNCRGSHWVPAEVDVSIRPGWFYHDSEQPKSLQRLLEIYYASVGRNALLLLNVPPDRRGLIPASDSLRLVEFRAALDTIFGVDLAAGAMAEASHVRGCKSALYGPQHLLDTTYHNYWAVDDSACLPVVTLSFPHLVTFNRVMLQEYIPLGQRVESYHLDYQSADGCWHPLAEATTIGYKRILLTPTVTARAVRLTIDRSLACPIINRLALFRDTVYTPPVSD